MNLLCTSMHENKDMVNNLREWYNIVSYDEMDYIECEGRADVCEIDIDMNEMTRNIWMSILERDVVNRKDMVRKFNYITNKIYNEIKANKPDIGLVFSGYAQYAAAIAIISVLKHFKIPCLRQEVGILPNTWYFDTNGFQHESLVFKDKNFYKILNDETKKESGVKAIDDYKNNRNSKYGQGDYTDGETIKTKYGIPEGSKIMFVAMQMPDDTQFSLFSRWIKGLRQFLDVLNSEVSDEYCVLLKPHPGFHYKYGDITEYIDMNIRDNFKWITCVENIHSLFVISDCVATVNSGVGLEALLYGVPVITFGNSIYEYFTHRIRCGGQLRCVLDSGEYKNKVDKDGFLNFVGFLAEDYYVDKNDYNTIREKIDKCQ